MTNRIRHKSAISITLDHDVLQFFAGRGRSGKINNILRRYIRARLGDLDDDAFAEEKTASQRLAQAFTLMGDEKDDFTTAVMIALIQDWRDA